MGRHRSVLALIATLPFVHGCLEIPPEIPDGYIGSPAASGWPPLAIYDPDPFHPRNRWYHRAFARRSTSGGLEVVKADAPLPALVGLAEADRVELLALLDAEGAVATPPAGSPPADSELRAGATDLLFRSDNLLAAAQAAVAGRNEGDWSGIAAALTRASMGPIAAADLPPASPLQPPPLRGGSWREIAPPAGVPQPSAEDPRWTRVLRDPASGALLLLRLRVALDFRGEPLLLDLVSECWSVGPSPGAAQHWRFDRAAHLQGRDPWRWVPDDTLVTESQPLLASQLNESAAPPAEIPSQAEAVRRALASLLR